MGQDSMTERDQSHTLLPAASLSSPAKKSQLKTPPHSTLRTKNLPVFSKKIHEVNADIYDQEDTSTYDSTFDGNYGQISSQPNLNGINDCSVSFKADKSNAKLTNGKHGLLSPEFSSPNLYEHVPLQTNDIFQASNINIQILDDSPNVDDSSEEVKLDRNENKENVSKPLEAPKFTKKTSNASSKRSKIMKTPKDFILPQPDEMPEINFTLDTKPPYSYASLIGMALLRSSDRRLTLADIYQWISDNFKYYKKGDVGWQNSIRHNLSLNKAFEKTEKSKEKKGHFWQIVSGYEHVFCNIKETKRNNAAVTINNSTKPSTNEPTTPKSHSQRRFAQDNDANNKADDDENGSYEDDNNHDDNNNSHNSDNDSNDYQFKDNHFISNNINPAFNTSLNVLSTPKSSEQYHYNNTQHTHSHLLTHRTFNHIYNNSGSGHSRYPSDGLGSIPELNIQYSSYNASPIGLQYEFSPSSGNVGTTSLDFTSSFSCRSNFELSPVRPIEPGPILEPISPNKPGQKVQLPSILKQLQSLQTVSKPVSVTSVAPALSSSTAATASSSSSSLSLSSSFTSAPLLSFEKQTKSEDHQAEQTPKFISTNKHMLEIPQSNLSNSKPQLQLTSTPQSQTYIHTNNNLNNTNTNNNNTGINLTVSNNNNMAKRLWASPSYLDDFYTSPIATGRVDNNNIPKNAQHQFYTSFSSIYGSPLPANKRRMLSKNNTNFITNGYSTNEIFGIDICTIQNHDDDESG